MLARDLTALCGQIPPVLLSFGGGRTAPPVPSPIGGRARRPRLRGGGAPARLGTAGRPRTASYVQGEGKGGGEAEERRGGKGGDSALRRSARGLLVGVSLLM